MKLIVGLGNPGNKYKNNRHNTGFAVLDKLQTETSKSEILNSKQVSNQKFEIQKRFKAEMLKIKDLVIAKPQTFMNSSGEAVAALATFYKIPAANIYVIHDDLDIKLGEYKIQKGSGPKVHNGLISIEEELSTKDFWRVRIGIENRHNEIAGNPVRSVKYLTGTDYVLQDFTDDEKKVLDQVIGKVVKELASLLCER
jgi:peptidyl-tRNA hydrolase, PTH1 family